MELYIGGYAQGKRAYVQKKYGIPDEAVADGAAEEFERGRNVRLYDHFHLWVKRKLAEGADAERLTRELLEQSPDCIILCDEIGNGIVPMEAAEREYRERTGRILCGLAEQAEHVERIVCGIGQRIK